MTTATKKTNRRIHGRPKAIQQRVSEFESLEPLILLSASPAEVQEVSVSTVMYERTQNGEFRQIVTFPTIYSMQEGKDFSGQADDHIDVPHDDTYEVAEGTFSLSFTPDDVFGYHALFSKDASGQESGGHITAFVANGQIKVRLQSTDDSIYLWSPEGSVENGETHHVAVTFGPKGFWLYLDGRMVDWNLDFQQGLGNNQEGMAIGANTWERTDDNPLHASHHFDGQIHDFAFTTGNSNTETLACWQITNMNQSPYQDEPTGPMVMSRSVEPMSMQGMAMTW